MAEVRIPYERFRDGSLPAVCAVSGVPAAEVFAFRAGRRRGALPLHGDVVRQLRQLRRAAATFAAGGLLFSVSAIVAGSAALGALGAVAAIAGIATISWSSVRMPQARPAGDEVLLLRVHEDFVGAVRRPPGKCDGCTSSSSCSVAEMDHCEGTATTSAAASSAASD